MGKILKDDRYYEKVDDNKYIWHQKFEVENNKEDVEKLFNILKDNNEKIKKDIEDHDTNKILEQVEKQLDNQHAVYQEAVTNFDKYIRDEINKIKNQKEEHRKNIISWLSKYDEYKKNTLERKKQQMEELENEMKRQLEENEKNLAQYEKIGFKTK